MKSSAVTGTPSDQTAFGLITYWMVSGEVEVTSTLGRRSLFTWGTSFGLITYALGSTDDEQRRGAWMPPRPACWG